MNRFDHMEWLNKLSPQLILLFTLLLFVNPSLYAQEAPGTVIGTVYNASTNEPLISATIFLSGTTIGTASDTEGKFTLQQVPPGFYELVVRYIGFEQQMMTFEIDSGETTNFGDIFLRVEPVTLDDVIVEANRDDEWHNYNLFKRSFLGQSENADLTEILNPEVLDFSIDPDTGELVATAQSEIHIMNHALGYELFTELESFRFETGDDIGYSFHQTRFIEMESEDPEQQEIWNQNRNTTYNGSFRHFLDSLVDGSVNDYFKIVNGDISLVNTRRATLHGSTRRIIQLVFLVETRRDKPLIVRDQNRQRSEIEFPSLKVLLVDIYGNLMNPHQVILYGNWALERMADLLPTDKHFSPSD